MEDLCKNPDTPKTAFNCKLIEDYERKIKEADSKRKKRCYKRKISSIMQEIEEDNGN
jgi:hypothetical protein